MHLYVRTWFVVEFAESLLLVVGLLMLGGLVQTLFELSFVLCVLGSGAFGSGASGSSAFALLHACPAAAHALPCASCVYFVLSGRAELRSDTAAGLECTMSCVYRTS